MSAIQHFEHGRMFWFSPNGNIWDGDIWVLIVGGQAFRFPETKYGSWSKNRLRGPLVPRYGFGQVWNNRIDIRDALGSATEAEETITLTVRVEDSMTYLTLPDQSLLRINDDSTWHTARIVSPPPDNGEPPVTPSNPDIAALMARLDALEADRVTIDKRLETLENHDVMADMRALLDEHIERSLNINEVGDYMAARLKRPLTSAQLLK